MLEIRLEFLFTDVSQHLGIFGGLCTHVFYSWMNMGKRLLKHICIVKSKIIQPHPKYITRNFQNLIRERFIKDIH